nr:VP1 [porcine birnavirus]
MSDIFNTPSSRSKITAALGIHGKPGEPIEDVLIPKLWVPPPDPLKSPAQVAVELKQHGYIILKARSLPENEEYPTAEVLPDLDWLLQTPGSTLPTELQLPIGEKEYFPKYYPTHSPSHDKPSSNPPDISLLKQMTFLYLQQEEARNGREVRLLRDCIQDYHYGSGTYTGQIKRLIAMKEVATGRNPNKNPLDKYTLEAIAQMMEVTLPIGSPGDDAGPWPPLTRVPSRMLENDDGEIRDYLPKLNLKASSGLPYIGRTKGQTIGEMLAISNQFIRELSQVIKQGAIGKGTKKKNLHKVLSDFWYLSCGLLFPKAERYKKSEWLTKTRNIWSAPSPTHLLISMITWPVMTNSNNNFMNIEGCPSLYKFNPLRGGMDRAVNWILTRTEPDFLIYADNIYICMEDTWFSIDLEKGEANCTRQHMQAAMYYILSRGWSDNGDPMFNQTWASFAMNIAPALVVDSSCLLMNLQLHTYGQGSGNAATFLNNHLISTILMYEWRQAGCPRPGTEAFKDLEKVTGTNFKVEREIPEIKSKLLALVNQPQGYLNGGQEPEEPGSTVELDLLGWATTYSRDLGQYVPVLDRERLFLSAALPKGLENKEMKKMMGYEQAYKIVRYEALRLVGGWNYPLLNKACMNNSSNLRQQLEAKDFPLEGVLKNWTDLSEFGETFQGLNIKLETNPQTLVKLNKPEEPPQPNTNKPVNTAGLKAVQKALTTGAYRNTSGLAGLTLLATARAKVERAREALRAAKEIQEKETEGSWFDQSEGLAQVLEASDALTSAAHGALEETAKTLEALKETALSTPKPKVEKVPEHAANPVVHMHLPSQRATGVQAALMGIGTSAPMGSQPASRSKNAKKMAKRRQKARLR